MPKKIVVALLLAVIAILLVLWLRNSDTPAPQAEPVQTAASGETTSTEPGSVDKTRSTASDPVANGAKDTDEAPEESEVTTLLTSGQTTREKKLRGPKPRVPITIRVVDDKTGTIIVGAKVLVPRSETTMTTTNSSGVWRGDVPATQFGVVGVKAKGYRSYSETVRFDEAPTVNLKVSLKRNTMLEVTVRHPDGSWAEGVAVRARAWGSHNKWPKVVETTDREGFAILDNLDAPRMHIEFGPGGGPTIETTDVELADAEINRLEHTLATVPTIHGTVLVGGKPADGSLHLTDSYYFRSSSVAVEAGRFSLQLHDEDEYRVEFRWGKQKWRPQERLTTESDGIVLSVPIHEVTVAVISPEGPIPNRRVAFRGALNTATVTTNNHGVGKTTVVAGGYEVKTRRPESDENAAVVPVILNVPHQTHAELYIVPLAKLMIRTDETTASLSSLKLLLTSDRGAYVEARGAELAATLPKTNHLLQLYASGYANSTPDGTNLPRIAYFDYNDPWPSRLDVDLRPCRRVAVFLNAQRDPVTATINNSRAVVRVDLTGRGLPGGSISWPLRGTHVPVPIGHYNARVYQDGDFLYAQRLEVARPPAERPYLAPDR